MSPYERWPENPDPPQRLHAEDMPERWIRKVRGK